MLSKGKLGGMDTGEAKQQTLAPPAHTDKMLLSQYQKIGDAHFTTGETDGESETSRVFPEGVEVQAKLSPPDLFPCHSLAGSTAHILPWCPPPA